MSRLKQRLFRPIDRMLRRLVDQRVERLLTEDSYNLQRALQRKAAAETAEWLAANVPLHLRLEDRLAVLDCALGHSDPANGLLLEFGVYRGATINHLAGRLPAVTFHGFDSFEGLREPWLYRDSGAFGDLSGPPTVRDNVRLVEGTFELSLPAFLEDHPESVAFLHVDCDLYSSAKTVLSLLYERLSPGSVIVFDEYFNYPNWQAGEHRAWSELCAERGLSFEYVAYSDKHTRSRPGGQQLALRITGTSAPGQNPDR